MKTKITKIFTILIFAFLSAGVSNGQTNESSEKQKEKNQQTEKEQPLKIKNRPKPKPGDCGQGEATVRQRVTFDKSAKVTNVEVVASSNCDFFDKEAVRAAKKIKFNPQMKNGEPITVTKILEYKFTRY